jgi:hypothetical protein
MRSRASGALSLDASLCCYGERALALSQPRLFPNSLTRCLASSDVRCRLVGTRSRARRRRLSDNDIRCSASHRRWFPARPAQHVHRRRNNGKGRIPSAFTSARGRNGKRRVETSNAGRAGAHRPSEALHPKRPSGRAAADRAGARPYRATRCENALKCASPDRAGVRPHQPHRLRRSHFPASQVLR